MRIRWTPAAAEDLEDIHNYLTKHHPDWARPTVIEIHAAVRSLKQSPNRGRKGREEETRELLHPRLPYIVAYRVREATIEILHIWHASRDRLQ
jgi:plasmid stabilization system protein ParE